MGGGGSLFDELSAVGIGKSSSPGYTGSSRLGSAAAQPLSVNKGDPSHDTDEADQASDSEEYEEEEGEEEESAAVTVNQNFEEEDGCEDEEVQVHGSSSTVEDNTNANTPAPECDPGESEVMADILLILNHTKYHFTHTLTQCLYVSVFFHFHMTTVGVKAKLMAKLKHMTSDKDFIGTTTLYEEALNTGISIHEWSVRCAFELATPRPKN